MTEKTKKPRKQAKRVRFLVVDRALLRRAEVECSDDGLMTEVICQCLNPVIQAIGIAATKKRPGERWT